MLLLCNVPTKTVYTGVASKANCTGFQDPLFSAPVSATIADVCVRELRIELTLPGSGLVEEAYPHLLPQPPVADTEEDALNHFETSQNQVLHEASPQLSTTSSDTHHMQTGWFFYLAEIALRRIVNRVLLHRYRRHGKLHPSRYPDMDIENLQETVSDFDMQLRSW